MKRPRIRGAHAPSRAGDDALAVANFDFLDCPGPIGAEKLGLGEDGFNGFIFQIG